MSAQLIKLITTKAKKNHNKTMRTWVLANELVEQGNGITFFPYFCNEGDHYSLHLFFFDTLKQKNIEVVGGRWIDDYIFETGIKLLPMAVSYLESGRPNAVFIEFAVIKRLESIFSN